MSVRLRWLLVLASLIAAPAAAAAGGTLDPAAIDRAIDDVLARYELPGLAVGIVHDGKVAYRRTAGETVAGSGQPITPRTLFKIASNSKAMTAAVLARLVDAGKLRWDDPVRRHLPGFRMHDPWVTEHMQVRDLLIHNSGLGLGAGDLMLWPEPNRFSRADILAALTHLRPASSFRSSYAYDNILYIVAGELAAAVAGVPWETLLAREVFAPLGLERCLVGAFARDAVGDIAQPHRLVDGRYVAFRRDPPQVPAITSAAAGGVRCSLDDMLRWAQAWLDPEHAPEDWLSTAQRQAVWHAQMPMPLSARQRDWDGSHFNAYGYGWRLSDVDGRFRAAHTGTLGGMYSSLTLLPGIDAAIVVLINGDAGEARTVLTQVLTRLLTAPGNDRGVDWYAQAIAAAATPPAVDGNAKAAERRAADPAALGERLGVWTDPWFGAVEICAEGSTVRFAARESPLLAGVLTAVGERLLVDWQRPEDPEAWLHFDRAGAAATLTLSHVDADADFSYDYGDLHFVRTGNCPGHDAPPPRPPDPPPPLVYLREHIPDVSLDIRYAGAGNFVGTRIDGYLAPRCLLLRGAAEALAAVAARLRPQRLRLHVFDCYRPERAVRHFMRWAADEADTSARAAYFPNLAKSQLVPDYIAERSGHSRAGTVDLTLLQCPTPDSPASACEELDMGTPFDFFDPLANTDAPGISARQRANRMRLREAMQAGGFENYPMEWWHYTWSGLPADAPAYDTPVQ